MDLYIELVQNDVVNNLRKSGKLSVSKDEHEAFCSLLQNDEIIV